MRHILIIFMLAFSLTAYGQSTPPPVSRGSNNATQVDRFLTVLNRLGIPTSATDTINPDLAISDAQNAAKLLFNTTSGKLRIYRPGTGWQDATAADLENYYTKAQVEGLIAAVSTVSNLSIGARTGTNVPIENSNGTGVSLPPATTSLAGVFSATDKTKLDGIAAGAQVNAPTNLSLGTRTSVSVPVNSSTGTGVTLPEATTTQAGLQTAADKTKLNGIEAGAQVNTVTSVAGKTGAVTLVKGDVGLGNVDNTTDANKPISNATQAALNLKLDSTRKVTSLSSPNDLTVPTTKAVKDAIDAIPGAPVTSVAGKTGAVTLDKNDISGLDQVDNTSDASKPVSNPAQDSLNTRERSANKATNFSVLNNSLYPTVLAVNNQITGRLGSYLPLSGGIVTGGVTITTGGVSSFLSGQDIRSGNVLYAAGSSTNLSYTSGGVVRLKNSSSNPFISFHNDDGSRKGFLGASTAATNQMNYYSDGANGLHAFYTNGVNRFYVSSNDVVVVSTIPLINNRAATANGHVVSKGFADTTYILRSTRGLPNGVATLDGSGKIPLTQIPTSIPYQGTWNASTNTPALADGAGTAGFYYRVSVSGTQNLGSGNITFSVGDDVIYNGSVWQRAPGGATVTNLALGTVSSSSIQITNSNGTGVTIPAVTGSNAGLMTAADKDKIDNAVVAETDPTVPGHVKTITTGNLSSWSGKLDSARRVTSLSSPNNSDVPTTQAVVNYVTTSGGAYVPISGGTATGQINVTIGGSTSSIAGNDINSGGVISGRGSSTNNTFTSSGTIRVKNSSSTPSLTFHNNDGSRKALIGTTSAGNTVNYFIEGSGHRHDFYTNGASRLQILDGSVIVPSSIPLVNNRAATDNSHVVSKGFADTTYVPKTRTITVNGTPYSLASNISLTLPNTTYTAGTGLTLTGTVFTPTFGTSAGTVAQGNHTHNISDLTGTAISGSTTGQLLRFNGTAYANWTPNFLTSADLSGYVPTSRTISAGTGLTGGGDLTMNRSLAVSYGTTAGTSAQGNDSRILNGQTAYSWGDHASAGYATFGTGASQVRNNSQLDARYLQSFTETDPTVPAYVKAITSGNISNWNAAFGWGNHASAGYLTSSSSLNASNLLSGTVPIARIPVGTGAGTVAAGDDSRILNGQIAYGWGNHANVGYATRAGNNTFTGNNTFSSGLTIPHLTTVSGTAGNFRAINFVNGLTAVEGNGQNTLRLYSSTTGDISMHYGSSTPTYRFAYDRMYFPGTTSQVVRGDGSMALSTTLNLNASNLITGTVDYNRLPVATEITRGAIRIGSGLSIDGAGVVSVSGGGETPYDLGSGTSIARSNGVTQYTSLSANRGFTVTMSGGDALDVQIKNTSGGSVAMNFSGATLPDGVDGTIPAGKMAVFSFKRFNNTDPAVVTKVIF